MAFIIIIRPSKTRLGNSTFSGKVEKCSSGLVIEILVNNYQAAVKGGPLLVVMDAIVESMFLPPC